MNIISDNEESSSVVFDLFSDCCGNMQHVLVPCFDPAIGDETNNSTIPIDMRGEENDTQGDFTRELSSLLGNVFVYDLSPDSLPFIHPTEEAEIIESATIANRKQIYFSCYLPSSGEKENVKRTLNELSPKSLDENNCDVEIIGRLPLGQEIKNQQLKSLLYDLNPEQPGTVLIKRGKVMIQTNSKTKKNNSSNQSIKCDYLDMILFNRFIVLPAKDGLDGDIDSDAPVDTSSKKKKSGALWKRSGTKGKHIEKSLHQAIPLISIKKVSDLGLCSPVHISSSHDTRTKSNSKNKNWALYERREQLQQTEPDCFSTDTALGTESVYDSAFRIDIEAGPSLNFICSSPFHKILWLHVLRNALIGAWRREYKIKDGWHGRDIGWPHHVVITNIFSACCCGDVSMLNCILQHPMHDDKTKLNLPDSSGYTGIHYAVMKNHHNCLTILLQHGLDPNIRDSNMFSAADHAYKMGNEKALEILSLYCCVPTTFNETMNMNNLWNPMTERDGRLSEMQDKSSQLKNGCAEYRSLVVKVGTPQDGKVIIS